ncbi:MAG: 4-hydroxy-tetrahydrodipicolinate synthase [Ignavibacteriae bacterium]|nr:4-hydroxy-tetrahydrodipicolinate synthase [Ignavibacteriota bacterium]
MTSNPFKGLGTALVTPFTRSGDLDVDRIAKLAERQIDGGVDMLVPCGTTGEAVTLSTEEYRVVVDTVVKTAAGRIPVVAGAGSNSTRKTIETASLAASLGADAVLVVTPYYNKPSQEGVFQHYEALCKEVTIPVIIYNVPGRTGCNMTADTQLRIAQLPNVVATKEASGNPAQIMNLMRRRPEGFHVLSGDDNLALLLIAAGADGVISTVSNEVPGEYARLVHDALAGRFDAAREMHYKLLELMDANFIESNPIPVKSAMALMGLLEESYRLPMSFPQDSTRNTLRIVLTELGLLS